jgi:hypothetical protein
LISEWLKKKATHFSAVTGMILEMEGRKTLAPRKICMLGARGMVTNSWVNQEVNQNHRHALGQFVARFFHCLTGMAGRRFSFPQLFLKSAVMRSGGRRMMLCIFSSVLLFLSGCYQTENGIVILKPDYEKRTIEVTALDLRILELTDEFLESEDAWSKDSERVCAQSRRLSLYCALEKASIEVLGEYKHRQAALQEVRFAIDDNYSGYWSKHRLGDFNGNDKTEFSDIKKVLAIAIKAVELKLGKL